MINSLFLIQIFFSPKTFHKYVNSAKLNSASLFFPFPPSELNQLTKMMYERLNEILYSVKESLFSFIQNFVTMKDCLFISIYTSIFIYSCEILSNHDTQQMICWGLFIVLWRCKICVTLKNCFYFPFAITIAVAGVAISPVPETVNKSFFD